MEQAEIGRILDSGRCFFCAISGRRRIGKDGRRFLDWRVEKTLYSPVFPMEQRRHLEDHGYLCRDLADFATALG